MRNSRGAKIQEREIVWTEQAGGVGIEGVSSVCGQLMLYLLAEWKEGGSTKLYTEREI